MTGSHGQQLWAAFTRTNLLNMCNRQHLPPHSSEWGILDQKTAFGEDESLGIVNKQTERPTEAEELLNFEQKTFSNDSYQDALPWLHDRPALSDNFMIAKKQFEGFEANTCNFILNKESVRMDYQAKSDRTIHRLMHYISHKNNLTRQGKVTTKLRVVFVASSHKEVCPFLNDSLLYDQTSNQICMMYCSSSDPAR